MVPLLGPAGLAEPLVQVFDKCFVGKGRTKHSGGPISQHHLGFAAIPGCLGAANGQAEPSVGCQASAACLTGGLGLGLVCCPLFPG